MSQTTMRKGKEGVTGRGTSRQCGKMTGKKRIQTKKKPFQKLFGKAHTKLHLVSKSQ